MATKTQELAKRNSELKTRIRVLNRELEIARNERDEAKKELSKALLALKKAEEASRTDALTGLANRRAFDERLKIEIARADREGSPLALVILDVDHFKSINDKHGHLTGDSTLKELGKTCKDSVRPTDLVARLGGDEFGIVLTSTSEAQGKVFIARLMSKVESELRLEVGKEIVSCTVSCGVMEWLPGESVESFIRRVDDDLFARRAEKRRHHI